MTIQHMTYDNDCFVPFRPSVDLDRDHFRPSVALVLAEYEKTHCACVCCLHRLLYTPVGGDSGVCRDFRNDTAPRDINSSNESDFLPRVNRRCSGAVDRLFCIRLGH